jgi:hypothetical protein
MRGGLVDVAVLLAEGVIGRTAESPTKEIGKSMPIGWPGFIATGSFRCHEVGISALPAGHAVIIMNIDHDLILGALGNRLVHPGGPLLVAVLDESKFEAGDAPFLIDRYY